MNCFKKTTLFAALICFFYAFNAKGQDDSEKIPENLFEMSLEELLTVEITTVSRKSESLTDAPGIVTVITAKEIELFGANNLNELIERVAGTLSVGSHLFPQNAISMRGSLLSHYDNHILILLNGRPLREGLTGGVNAPIYLSFPIASVLRIEVIRGPGSVLYGSNAFAGVVNIITNEQQTDTDDGIKGEVSAMTGTFGTTGFQSSITAKKGDLNISAGTSFLNSTGWRFIMLDERRDTVNQLYGQNNAGANIGIRYKKFSFSGAILNTVQNNLGALPVKSVGSPDKTLRASRAFFDAGYEFDFSEKWKGQLNATYNGFSEGYLVGASTFNAYSNDFILEFDNKITANEKANILFGGVGYYHSGGGYEQGVNNVPLYSQMWWSLYAQGDFKVKERLKLIAGVQANKPQDVDIDFVPRLGAVFHVNKKFGFKALYAQAFRSAFALERSLIAPGVLRGNPNLKPEKVGTLDLQAFWYSEKFQFSVNYFRSKMTDIITRVAVPNSPENTYINAGVLSISGVEAEVKASLSSNFFFIGSLSLNKNVLNDTIKNATHMPESAYKFGVAYTLGGVFNAGVFASSFADFGDVANVRPSRLNVNPVAKGFTYVTANVSVDVFRAMKVKSAQSLLLFCYVNNLLDSEIYYPEFSRRRINSIPGRPGRAFHFGLKFKF